MNESRAAPVDARLPEPENGKRMARAEDSRAHRVRVIVGLSWGIAGMFGALLEAVIRLVPIALAPLRDGMEPLALVAYVGFVVFNGYAEGYRGFQRAFSPRVAARARLLIREPTLLRVACAPLFLMALVDATRRRLLANWGLAIGILVLILALRTVSQPWRGVVDAGVVVGLGWGIVTTALELVRLARGHHSDADPEIADQNT